MKYIKLGISIFLALLFAAILAPVIGFAVLMWGYMISDICMRVGLSVTTGNVVTVSAMLAVITCSVLAVASVVLGCAKV